MIDMNIWIMDYGLWIMGFNHLHLHLQPLPVSDDGVRTLFQWLPPQILSLSLSLPHGLLFGLKYYYYYYCSKYIKNLVTQLINDAS